MLKHRVSNAGMHSAPAGPVVRKDPNLLHPGPDYCSTENIITQNTAENEMKDGIKRITEKYESLGNLSSSSRSSLGSPTIGSPAIGSPAKDNVFVFADMVARKFREGVTEQDLLQVETFYRSHKTEVYVGGCLVNVFFGSSKVEHDQWTFSCTGIPVLVLDSGEHLRERRLHIVIAEKGTGFTLWKDVIDNLTGYKAPNSNFHTLHLSTNHTQLAGLSFDDAGCASEFFSHIYRLTSDPNDELLKIGKQKKKKSVKEKKRKVKLPKKTEISQPCCFVHVTKLDRPEMPEEDSKPEPAASGSDKISQPFNFEHRTAHTGTESHYNSENLSNMVDSKLTLTSSDSVSSGLSDDRMSASTAKSWDLLPNQALSFQLSVFADGQDNIETFSLVCASMQSGQEFYTFSLCMRPEKTLACLHRLVWVLLVRYIIRCLFLTVDPHTCLWKRSPEDFPSYRRHLLNILSVK